MKIFLLFELYTWLIAFVAILLLFALAIYLYLKERKRRKKEAGRNHLKG